MKGLDNNVLARNVKGQLLNMGTSQASARWNLLNRTHFLQNIMVSQNKNKGAKGGNLELWKITIYSVGIQLGWKYLCLSFITEVIIISGMLIITILRYLNKMLQVLTMDGYQLY